VALWFAFQAFGQIEAPDGGGRVMVLASDLRAGMAIRIEREIYKVLEVESKAGAAKMSGVVKTKLVNARSGRMWEPHFRPQERIEDLELERRTVEFLYTDQNVCKFMRLDNFEQIEIPAAILGFAVHFLQPGMEVSVDFFGEEPISAAFPDWAEARVAVTAPASHSNQDVGWKEARLENGLEIHVPLFIDPGEIVRVDVRTGRYVERARAEYKRSA
jgi:elongation factor P